MTAPASSTANALWASSTNAWAQASQTHRLPRALYPSSSGWRNQRVRVALRNDPTYGYHRAMSDKLDDAHELATLGTRCPFTYRGSLDDGLTMRYGRRECDVSAGFLRALWRRFAGRTVKAGLHGGEPPPAGLGWWVRGASRRLNVQPLSVRDASRLAAILVAEGWASVQRRQRALYLIFAGHLDIPLEEPLPEETPDQTQTGLARGAGTADRTDGLQFGARWGAGS